MNIKYKVINYDVADQTLTVRYYTDTISEEFLAIRNPDTGDIILNEDGSIQACRTDINVTLWTDIEGEALHQELLRHAPVVWFSLLGSTPTAEVTSRNQALVGIERVQGSTLEEAVATKLVQLYEAYTVAIYQSVSYMGTTFQADANSERLLTITLASGALPEGFSWVDENNVAVAMTFAQLQGLSSVLLAQAWAGFSKLQDLKTSVRATGTIEAVNLITY